MSKKTFAVKLNDKLAERVKHFCRERGIKYGFFVEKALEERLEREELKEDLLDLKGRRTEEDDAVPFEDYLKQRDA